MPVPFHKDRFAIGLLAIALMMAAMSLKFGLIRQVYEVARVQNGLRLDALILLFFIIPVIASILLIRRNQSLHHVIEDKKLAEERATRIALHDDLTGLPNRRNFLEHLGIQLESSHRIGIAVLLIDLDGFKTVNDQMGHHVGDQVLFKVAERLSAVTLDRAFCARMGGDEFSVIVTARARNAIGRIAEEMAEDICRSMRQDIALDERITGFVRVSASIGLAQLSAHEDPFQLLRAADKALFEAKSKGKNNWRRLQTETAQDPSPLTLGMLRMN